MDNFKKSKIGGMVFILFIVLLIVGGQYLYNQVVNKKNDGSIINKKEIDYRIDKKKDYFYYTNESVISNSAEIFYKDVVINIKGQELLTESLAKENAIYKSNIKLISEANLLSNEMINYNNDNLYMLTYREYETHSFKNYQSLVIFDYMYDCFDLSTIHKEKSYVFDSSTGELLDTNEIFKRFDTSLDKIKEQVRSRLVEKQTIVNDIELIKIDETVNGFDNYGLYVNDTGSLVVSFLVKSTQTDYNDSITIN